VRVLVALSLAAAVPAYADKAYTRAQYLATARSLGAVHEPALAASLKKIDADKPASLASTAAALAATGRIAAALAYAGRAAVLDPSDANTANNLGATLELAGDGKRAAAVLRYAATLAPKNTLVLVNLAAVTHDAGDDAEAVAVLQRALKLDPTSCEATASLGLVYEAKHADVEALDKLQAALACHPTKQVREALDRVRLRRAGSRGASDPPPPSEAPLVAFPLAPPPPPVTPSRSRLAPGDDTLVVPPLPEWPDVIAYLSSVPSIKTWVDAIGNQLSAAMNAALANGKALVEQRMQAGSWTIAADPATKLFEYAYSDEPAKAALDATRRVYERRLHELERSYQRDLSALDKPLLDDKPANGVGRMTGLGANCPAERAATEREYLSWRALLRTRYDGTARLLAEYYAATGPLLAQFHDASARSIADETRQVIVLSELRNIGFELEMVRPMFYLSMRFVQVPCQGQPAPKPQPADDLAAARVNDAAPGECLLLVQKGGFTLDLYAVRVKFGCDKISIGFDGALYTGKVSYAPRTGELTLFGGVGLRAFDAITAGTGMSLRAKGGLYATFDTSSWQLVAGGLAVSAQIKQNFDVDPVTAGGSYEYEKKWDAMPVVAMALAPYGGTVRNVRPARP
jgi:Flp pilus assembly protein TadD